MIDPNLTKAEIRLLDKLERRGFIINKAVKQSDRLFDVHVEGTCTTFTVTHTFSAWLPLFAIRELTLWTSYEVARFSRCYADMAMAGDWSGIRDSEPEEIWEMFENCVDLT